jgi:hypothetical protein
MSQSRLEAYLDEIEAHLAHLSGPERREWREEAAQHLQALADAEEELGLSRPQAEEAALRRFGQARQIGELLGEATKAPARRRATAMLASALPGLTCSVIGSLATLLFLARLTWSEQLLGMRPAVPEAIPMLSLTWLGHLVAGAWIGRKLGMRRYLLVGALPYLALLPILLLVSGATSLPAVYVVSALVAGLGGVGLGAFAARFTETASTTPARPKAP